MISAIDSSRLAAKDDWASGAAMQQVQDKKFNSILNTASRHEPAPAVIRQERPVSPAEPQPRAVYGEAARPRPQATRPEERQEARPEPHAEGREAEQPQAGATASTQNAQAQQAAKETQGQAKGEGKAEGKAEEAKAAQQDKDKALKDADALPPTADQMAGAVALTGVVLTAQDIIAQSNARSSVEHRSIGVQLGAAAYQMSPHSEAEKALAQQLGALPPPDYTQAIDPQAQLNGRNGIRTPAENAGPQHADGEPVLVVDALAMVELSKQAQAARAAAAKPDVGAAPAGSAMARDQYLNQIGVHPTAVNPATVAAQQLNPALKEVPKELLNSGKDSQVKAPDVAPVSASTATAAGAGAAAGVATAAATQPADRPQSLSAGTAPTDSRMVDKVVQQARWMIRNDKQEVTMRLEPEHLGAMKLHVTHKDGAMHVEMTVDNAAAKHMLDSNIGQLRERFAQENLAQGNLLHVDVRQGGNSELAQHFGKQGSEVGTQFGARGTSASAEEASVAAPRRAWSNSNLSIYA